MTDAARFFSYRRDGQTGRMASLIWLHEAGLQHETVMVSTKSHKLQDGTDYYSINPLGYVPFLVLDNGDTLHEGPAIVQYLADLVPERT